MAIKTGQNAYAIISEKEGKDMTGIDNEIAKMIENLHDAGCDTDIIEPFLNLRSSGKREEQLSLLAKYRYFLLNRIHENQKKLDCLDYLIYKIKREEV